MRADYGSIAPCTTEDPPPPDGSLFFVRAYATTARKRVRGTSSAVRFSLSSPEALMRRRRRITSRTTAVIRSAAPARRPSRPASADPLRRCSSPAGTRACARTAAASCSAPQKQEPQSKEAPEEGRIAATAAPAGSCYGKRRNQQGADQRQGDVPALPAGCKRVRARIRW